MDMLGHANIATTMDIYGHALPETHKDAADKLDKLFAPPKGTRKKPLMRMRRRKKSEFSTLVCGKAKALRRFSARLSDLPVN